MRIRHLFSDDNPYARVLVAIAGLLILVAIFASLSFGTHAVKKSDAKSTTTIAANIPSTSTTSAVASDGTNGDVTQTPDGIQTPASQGTQATATTQTTMSAAQIAQPEADMMTPDQLDYRYGQAHSGLDGSQYKKAVDTAKLFALADVTGQGADKFASYYTDSHLIPTPWMVDYHLQYATCMASDQAQYIKCLVWFDGTETLNNTKVAQARLGFYLETQQDGTLKPYPYTTPSRDPQVGIEIVPN